MDLDVTFDGTALSSFGISLVEYTRSATSSLKNASLDIPGADGSYKLPKRYSECNIKMQIVLEDTTAKAVRQKIRNFTSFITSKDEDYKIIFSDDQDTFSNASLSSSEEYKIIEGTDNCMACFNLEFAMHDPFVYENNITEIEKTLESGETIEFENDGIYCPFELTLVGTMDETEYAAVSLGQSAILPATNTTITVNGQDYIYYTGVILQTDTIVIDTDNYSVTVNGVEDLSGWSGDFPNLKNGKNIIKIDNLESGSLTVKIKYNKRWL